MPHATAGLSATRGRRGGAELASRDGEAEPTMQRTLGCQSASVWGHVHRGLAGHSCG